MEPSLHNLAEFLVDRIQHSEDLKGRRIPSFPDEDGLSEHEFLARALEEAAKVSRIKDLAQQIAAWPSDPRLRLMFGILLFETGQRGEAVPQLQQATRGPDVRREALMYLGKCFLAKDMPDLAIKHLLTERTESGKLDEIGKEVAYNLATAYQKVGKDEEALNYLKRIYEIDYGFKDVAKQVEGHFEGAQA
jgi:thioredoxin-like negative regulator of GroEL